MLLHLHLDELNAWQHAPLPMLIYRDLANGDRRFFILPESIAG